MESHPLVHVNGTLVSGTKVTSQIVSLELMCDDDDDLIYAPQVLPLEPTLLRLTWNGEYLGKASYLSSEQDSLHEPSSSSLNFAKSLPDYQFAHSNLLLIDLHRLHAHEVIFLVALSPSFGGIRSIVSHNGEHHLPGRAHYRVFGYYPKNSTTALARDPSSADLWVSSDTHSEVCLSASDLPSRGLSTEDTGVPPIGHFMIVLYHIKGSWFFKELNKSVNGHIHSVAELAALAREEITKLSMENVPTSTSNRSSKKSSEKSYFPAPDSESACSMHINESLRELLVAENSSTPRSNRRNFLVGSNNAIANCIVPEQRRNLNASPEGSNISSIPRLIGDMMQNSNHLHEMHSMRETGVDQERKHSSSQPNANSVRESLSSGIPILSHGNASSLAEVINSNTSAPNYFSGIQESKLVSLLTDISTQQMRAFEELRMQLTRQGEKIECLNSSVQQLNNAITEAKYELREQIERESLEIMQKNHEDFSSYSSQLDMSLATLDGQMRRIQASLKKLESEDTASQIVKLQHYVMSLITEGDLVSQEISELKFEIANQETRFSVSRAESSKALQLMKYILLDEVKRIIELSQNNAEGEEAGSEIPSKTLEDAKFSKIIQELNEAEKSNERFSEAVRKLRSYTSPDGLKGLNQMEKKTLGYLRIPQVTEKLQNIEESLREIRSVEVNKRQPMYSSK